ncbi:MAG: flavodoxin family protein [Synergistaceae bacterium]|jgi:multimeric flavodoxin WrbA|nr:flavodoxin family protein [Synergistaceae bacterium]
MGKNVVVLSGSPRKGGTTDRLVDAFAEGAAGSERVVSVFRVADMEIGGCLGCNHCFRETGVCARKDGMGSVLEELRKADVLVFASPVYYFGVSSQLKAAVDRMYALMKEGMRVKRAALLMTCGDDTDAAAAPSIAMFRRVFAYMRWEEAGIVVTPRLHEPSDIEGREELERAKNLGRNI